MRALRLSATGRLQDAEITPDIKRKVLGLNAAKLYDMEVPEELQLVTAGQDTGFDVTEKPATDE